MPVNQDGAHGTPDPDIFGVKGVATEIGSKLLKELKIRYDNSMKAARGDTSTVTSISSSSLSVANYGNDSSTGLYAHTRGCWTRYSAHYSVLYFIHLLIK
jgi:hypothetical protein